MEEALKLLKTYIQHASPISDEAWNDLSAIWKIKKLKRDEYFAQEGKRPSDMGFVVSGVVRAFYRTKDGDEYNKTFFTESTIVAALAGLVRGTESYINLQALEDTRLLVTDYSVFTELYDTHHSLERLGRRAIEAEWVKKEIRELRLVLCTAEERYAYFKEEHPGLEHRIAQYHIASFLGITPVALSRIRGRIMRAGESEKQNIPI